MCICQGGLHGLLEMLWQVQKLVNVHIHMAVVFVSAREGWDEIPYNVMGDGIMLPASLTTTKEKNPHENRSFSDSVYNQ